MRISDWSSDVCSSYLVLRRQVGVEQQAGGTAAVAPLQLRDHRRRQPAVVAPVGRRDAKDDLRLRRDRHEQVVGGAEAAIRTEERRVGKEWVSPCRSRW